MSRFNVRIYFESSNYAEVVAAMSFEPTTQAFWDAMLLEAVALGFDKVAASIDDDSMPPPIIIEEMKE